MHTILIEIVCVDTSTDLSQNHRMTKMESKKFDVSNLPQIPDIRQSICHTLVAAGFLLAKSQNPFAINSNEKTFHLIIVGILMFAVALSWHVFYKKFLAWKELPEKIKVRVIRSPAAIKQRAISHLLLSMLSVTLTAIGYLGHLATPAEQITSHVLATISLSAGAIVGILAMAVLAQTIRDILASTSTK